MGGGSKKRTETTTTLPGNQQANVDALMSGALDFYNTGGPQFYQGNTVAGPTADTLAGRQSNLDYAGGVGRQLVGAVNQGDQFWLDPRNIFNPSRIPGFQQATDSVVQNTTRNLTEGILPQIRSGSVASGAYGGSRQGIAEGLAAGRTSDALAEQLASMQMGAYGQGLNMYNAAANRVPQNIQAGLMPGQVQQQVGAAQQADEQARINAERERWTYEQLAPLINLENLQQLTGVSGQYGGKTVGTETVKSGGGIGQAIGGALSLASILFPPIAPVAGIAGAVGGMSTPSTPMTAAQAFPNPFAKRP